VPADAVVELAWKPSPNKWHCLLQLNVHLTGDRGSNTLADIASTRLPDNDFAVQ
jgi:hypothetical protein